MSSTKRAWELLPSLRRDDDKIAIPLVQARLEICEACPELDGNRCKLGRALDLEPSGMPGMAHFNNEGGCPKKRWPADEPDCVELGEAFSAGQLEQMGLVPKACSCAGKIRRCGIHGKCTVAVPRDNLACCAYCPDKSCGEKEESIKSHFEWISTRQLLDDTVSLLLPKLPPNLSGICGIARSGMLPASLLATYLHLPLWTIDQYAGEPIRLPHGSRGKILGFAGDYQGPLLIVDDTVYGGAAIRDIQRRLHGQNMLYAVVYVRPEAKAKVNFIGRELPAPHLLEWNLFNTGIISGHAQDPAMRGGVATDFDGIVCRDDDPQKPLYVPKRNPVPLIITGRSESHRAATVNWLEHWGGKFDQLEMRPANVGESADEIGTWKASVYDRSRCSIYFESCPTQAKIIHEKTRRPVCCPKEERVYQ